MAQARSSKFVRTAGTAAIAALAVLAAACSSSKPAASPATTSANGGSGGSSPAQAPSSAAGGGSSDIKGQRFTMMVQSTPNVNKVVEAHAIDIMKQDGVNASIKYNASTPNVAISQLLNGDIDVYGEAVTGGVAAAAQGIPLVDFAVLQPRQDYVFIAKPNIKSLADLKGKKIGVQDTTGVNYAQALIVLQAAKLDVKDVSIIAAGGQSSRLPALVAGRVDATMLSHSAQIQLAPQGYNVLYDFTKQSANLYDDNGFATKNWLAQHKALAVEFNKAILESFKWFDDPANADAVVTEALAIQKGADKAQTTKLFDMLRQASGYPEGTIVDPSVLDEEQNLFKQAKAITDTVPIDQWVDASFAQQAKSALGSS
jgi:NitT/TauT family transport system substrate-binding protein